MPHLLDDHRPPIVRIAKGGRIHCSQLLAGLGYKVLGFVLSQSTHSLAVTFIQNQGLRELLNAGIDESFRSANALLQSHDPPSGPLVKADWNNIVITDKPVVRPNAR